MLSNLNFILRILFYIIKIYIIDYFFNFYFIYLFYMFAQHSR